MAADLNNANYTQNGPRQGLGVVVLDANGDTASSSSPSPVKAGDPASVNVTIPNGGSLSDAGYVHGALVGIIVPAAWDTAVLSFQGALTAGGTFFDIYDQTTARSMLSAEIAGGQKFLSLSLNSWTPFNYLKLRSGTAASPVNQTAARVFTLVYAQ